MAIKRTYILILSLLCLVLIIWTACVPLWNSETVLFLEDLAAGKEESRLKNRTPIPAVVSIEYEMSGLRYQADLYQPGEAPLASIVLIPGVAQHGKDDPRLVAFATTLSRFRFMVLVPDIPNLRDLKIRAEDSQTIKDAFIYLVSRPDTPTQAQIGIGAFSYAVGPAILAALDPVVREKADFLLSVGGYYDIEQAVTFFTTGFYRHKDEWHFLEPNEYGKWVFVISNVDRLSNTIDKANFHEIAQRKMKNPNASIDDLVMQLTPEAASILTLLQNQNPELVPDLIVSLPTAIHADLNALNLSNKDLNQLKSRLILLHGTDDNIIPYTESIALANAVAKDQAVLFLIDGLTHVDVHPEKLNKWAILRAIDALLNVRKIKTKES